MLQKNYNQSRRGTHVEQFLSHDNNFDEFALKVKSIKKKSDSTNTKYFVNLSDGSRECSAELHENNHNVILK